jgi:predicted ATPase/DNA-binding winged helix-turn-helix (wHTH) protein
MKESLRVFGRLQLDVATKELWLDDRPLHVGGRAFAILDALIAHRGELVRKEKLIEAAWPGRVVDEGNLAVQISTLRKELGPDFIVTIPGRGYRFVAPAESPAQAQQVPAAAPARDTAQAGGMALPSLVGRQTELEWLEQAIAAHHLTTLTGAGGIGKSRLARQIFVTRRDAYADGAGWVDLEALSEPGQLPVALARAVGLRLGENTVAALVNLLQPLQMLLCLDGAERLVDAVAEFAVAVLSRAPGVCLLVTSQVPLRLRPEKRVRLGPLSLPEGACDVSQARRYGALALFEQRAQSVDLSFRLDETSLGPVLDICRRLDGLPLAIELAAARVPSFGPHTLARELARHLRVLGSGRGDMPARQRTLLASVEWSHGLLDERERIVFRRLAVFSGGCSLAVARAFFAEGDQDEWEAIDAIGELVDRGLVEADSREIPRYRLLETARTFAMEQLVSSGELSQMRRHHAVATTRVFTELLDDFLAGRAQWDAIYAALWPELDNAREALDWAARHDAETAVTLAVPLSDLIHDQLFTEACRVWELTEALLSDELPVRLRARWAAEHAMFWANRNVVRARAWAEAALELNKAQGDTAIALLAYYVLVACLSRHGEDASGLLQEVRKLDNDRLPAVQRYRVYAAEAACTQFGGPFERTVEARQRALACAREFGDRKRILVEQNNLMDVYLNAGRWKDAAEIGTELLASARKDVRQRQVLALALLNVTAAHAGNADLDSAGRVAPEGWRLALQFGLRPFWADILAQLAILQQRYAAAAQLIGYGDARYREYGTVRQGNEARAAKAAEHDARAALGDAEFDRLRDEGQTLSDEQIVVQPEGVAVLRG